MTNRWVEGCPRTVGPVWIYRTAVHELVRAFVFRAGADSINTHKIIDGDGNYYHQIKYWHPWQEDAPAPPEIEPPAGTWSDRPWRSGLHRVVWVDAVNGVQHVNDVMITQSERYDLPWVNWQAIVVGRASACSAGGFSFDARWYRYPDPQPDVQPPGLPVPRK